MRAVADTYYSIERGRRLNWRRLGILAAVALFALVWARPMMEPLIRGWYTACEVQKQREEQAALEEQLQRLKAKRDFILTDEGKNVEARRQFDVGPPGEVRIEVKVRSLQPQPTPASLGERFMAGLNRVGGAALNGLQSLWDIFHYWWHLELRPPDRQAPAPTEEATASP